MCNCWSTHNVLYMVAGAAFWEATVHAVMHLTGALPLTYWGYAITGQVHLLIIGVLYLIGFSALYAAKKGNHTNCSSC